jgi:cardiolipin synthase
VQSPYFVPDEAIEQALATQALGGVDVRLMMTGVPDKRIAFSAAFSYLDDLVRAGGRVLQYHAGFFHAKSLVIDGQLAVIGTTNFDIRSFLLHDEISLFFFDAEVAEECERIFAADEELCRVIDPAYLDAISGWARMKSAFARLWSRLL